MAAKRSRITLCLIQGGQTIWDADRRVHGSTDLPLSENGRRAVLDELGRHPLAKATVIHHPNDEAATDTAQLVADRWGAKTRVVDELADPNLGLLEGLSATDFEDRFPSRHRQWEDDPMSLTPPEGEPLTVAAQRIFRAVAKVIKRSRGSELAVVLHDLGAGMIRCWLADRPLGDLWSMVHDRPQFERYVIPISMLAELERAAEVKEGA
jgi:broad specificity phosphatase PhoE